MRVRLVINPDAGAGRAAGLAGAVRTAIDAAGAQVVTDGPVSAWVVVGGDGTVHRALPELLAHQTPLVLVPAGSGNDLAATVGLSPADPLAALRAFLAAGESRYLVRHLDCGQVLCGPSTTLFASVLGSGFDTAVTARAARLRWVRGPHRYTAAILAELATFEPSRYRITVDDSVVELDAVMLAVGVGTSYGGGIPITARADPTDGRLDLTMVRPLPRRQLLALLPRLQQGAHLRHPGVRTVRGDVISVESLDQASAPAQADGEPAGHLPLSVRCLPGALPAVVLAPVR